VVLGANDHGKTNFLRALQHLNEDAAFEADKHLAWDNHKPSTELPRIRYFLQLDQGERAEILDLLNARQESQDDDEEDEKAERAPALRLADIPADFCLERKGCGAALELLGFDAFDQGTVLEVVLANLPTVVLLKSWGILSGTATAGDVAQEGTNKFMRGVLHYAGLNPDDTTLFQANLRTERTLADASEKLTATLRQSWSQGGDDLTFILAHTTTMTSVGAIALKIRDRAVQKQYINASERSDGFTQYFGLKMILHARTRDYASKAHIFLFDEPGIYLHPGAQFDLLQVLEALAKENQVIYVTHSLFMINKTFPTRHRLLIKEENGTKVDGKPFRGRWGPVVKTLGVSLAGTILFANHVLLTEGDSDAIYIEALLQVLARMRKIDVDLNGFTCMGTGDGKNADALLRMLSEARPTPRIGFLFDGDEGGRNRKAEIKKPLKHYGVEAQLLERDTVIEDYLVAPDLLFVPALAIWTTKMLESFGRPVPPNLGQVFHTHRTHAKARTPDTNLADWASLAYREIAGLGALSKVGVAREYLLQLQEHDAKATELKSALKLAKRIQKLVGLPSAFAERAVVLRPLP
jgi:hypothetical protein